VYPATATVPAYGELMLSALLVGNPADPRVNFTLESGSGTLLPYDQSSAVYVASADTVVRIRASANFLSSVAQVIDLTVSSQAMAFSVAPEGFSQLPYLLTPSTPQTFAAVRPLSPGGSLELTGVRGAEFILFPALSVSTTRTVTPDTAQTRLYAREVSTNVFASTDLQVATTAEPSIAISPAVSTIAPSAVVQLTAAVSTGDSVQWDVVSGFGAGSVTQGGTYTAPATPGVYVVRATALNGSGLRFALATIIVQ
jgi:hypothetical protein